MLRLAGFECIRHWHEVLLPVRFGALFNKLLVRVWPFTELALANFIVARPKPEPVQDRPRPPSSSLPGTNRGILRPFSNAFCNDA